MERWFAELTTKKIKRGAHTSVKALEADIRDWIEHWNQDPRPYVWVKTAEQILDSLARYCQKVSAAADPHTTEPPAQTFIERSNDSGY